MYHHDSAHSLSLMIIMKEPSVKQHVVCIIYWDQMNRHATFLPQQAREHSCLHTHNYSSTLFIILIHKCHPALCTVHTYTNKKVLTRSHMKTVPWISLGDLVRKQVPWLRKVGPVRKKASPWLTMKSFFAVILYLCLFTYSVSLRNN